MVGGEHGGGIHKKGVFKERLHQVISVTAKVTIPTSVHRFKLALRDCQETIEARNIPGGGERQAGGTLNAMGWGWNLDFH